MVSYSGTLGTGLGGFLVGAASVWFGSHQIRRELSRCRWAAEHDCLTGLANRTGIRHRYEAERAAGRQVTVVLLDLDGFKTVNDTWGHPAGDLLLTVVARRLTTACEPEAFVGRLAGDEFLVLLPAAVPAAAAVTSMLATLAAPVVVDEAGAVVLTPAASAGIAAGRPHDGWSMQLGRADIALYHANDRRPDGVVVFRDGMERPKCPVGDPVLRTAPRTA